jgi:iron(III) transport system permease protein
LQGDTSSVSSEKAAQSPAMIGAAKQVRLSMPVMQWPPPVALILIALLAAGIIPPFVFLALSSLHEIDATGGFGAFTFDNFITIFSSRAFGPTLLNSALYSLGSALFALLMGAVQAWLAERTDAPFRQLLYLASIVSLGIPYVLYIVAWLLFLGKAGLVNMLLRDWLGGAGPYINIYSLGGMIFVEGLLWSPLAFLLLAPVFRNADASFEEAASICGAGIFSTIRHVTFGMARPAFLALGLLVFIKASESFEVPALVGLPGSSHVLTSTIYQRLTLDVPPDTGSASAFGILLLVVMAVLLQLYARVAVQTHRYRTVTGKGYRPRILRLGPWRYIAGSLIVAIPCIVVLIPLLNIVRAALLPFYQPFNLAALPKVGVANFIHVFNSPSFHDAILNTLMLGAATATIVTAFSALAGWCVARKVPGGRLIDMLAALPLVFPAIVLGLAYLGLFVQGGTQIYGTLLSLVVVSVVAYVPYGLRYAQLGVIQIHPELEEAAAIAGARQVGAFMRIVLPLLTPALISCWLFVFLLAVRAVSLVLLLAGPNSQVVAVTLFDYWNNGQIGELAALGCVWTAIMTVVSVAFFVVVRRFQLAIE